MRKLYESVKDVARYNSVDGLLMALDLKTVQREKVRKQLHTLVTRSRRQKLAAVASPHDEQIDFVQPMWRGPVVYDTPRRLVRVLGH